MSASKESFVVPRVSLNIPDAGNTYVSRALQGLTAPERLLRSSTEISLRHTQPVRLIQTQHGDRKAAVSLNFINRRKADFRRVESNVRVRWDQSKIQVKADTKLPRIVCLSPKKDRLIKQRPSTVLKVPSVAAIKVRPHFSQNMLGRFIQPNSDVCLALPCLSREYAIAHGKVEAKRKLVRSNRWNALKHLDEFEQHTEASESEDEDMDPNEFDNTAAANYLKGGYYPDLDEEEMLNDLQKIEEEQFQDQDEESVCDLSMSRGRGSVKVPMPNMAVCRQSSENESLFKCKPRRMHRESLKRKSGIREGFNAREKFRKVSTAILTAMRWILLLKNKDKDEPKMSTFTELAEETKFKPASKDLSFDKNYFTANKDLDISAEVRQILTLPPKLRTQEQVQTVVFGLQHLRAFAEYPLHMQEKLAQVARFLDVPPKKVIVRQGHKAENFYFILSGQALVTILEKGSGGANLRTAAIIRKGRSFGEVALMYRSKRTATVIAQGRLHLLQIDRRDFIDIFMRISDSNGIPEHINYLRNLELLKNWPVTKLLEHPETCLFNYFKRGNVVVRDSNKSDWIVVVKSGSCMVIKHITTEKLLEKSSQQEEETLEEKERHKRDEDLKQRVEELNHMIAVYEACSTAQPTPAAVEPASNEEPQASDDDEEELAVQHIEPEEMEKSTVSAGFSNSRFRSYSKKSKQIMHKKEKQKESDPVQQVSLKPLSVFVQVELLKPRDFFGLNTLDYDDEFATNSEQTSVSLISKGAECVLIQKEMFCKHCNVSTKRAIREVTRTYPNEETLLDNYLIKQNWDEFKYKVLKTYTDKKFDASNV